MSHFLLLLFYGFIDALSLYLYYLAFLLLEVWTQIVASCWELQEHSLTKHIVVFSRTWYSSNLIEHHPIKQSFTTCSISNFCNLIFYPQSRTHEYRWMWNYCNLNTGEWKQVKYRWMNEKTIELKFTSDVNSQLLGAPQIGSNEIFWSWILTKFVTLMRACCWVVITS